MLYMEQLFNLFCSVQKVECVELNIWQLLLFWFFFQGSYGVVKLAYNEDDNTYYVSHTLLLELFFSVSDYCCS